MYVLECQTAYAAAMARGKTPDMTERAKQDDKASHAELNCLRAKPGNNVCFDCTATKPGWAVLPWGHWVCIDCAQVHRNLGRHISQTKAVNTGTYLWYPHELRIMREVGNVCAVNAFTGAPSKPSRDAPTAVKAEYARQKYELRRWGPVYATAAEAPIAPTAPAPIVPTAPAPIKPAAGAKKLKSAAGLAHAKRMPAASPSSQVDLISLEPASPSLLPPSPPSLPPLGEQAFFAVDFTAWEAAPSGDWASFSDVGAPHLAEGVTAEGVAWDQKKAQILSQFSSAPSCRSAQLQELSANSRHSPALFFAGYGL